jgi:hypothetical protein
MILSGDTSGQVTVTVPAVAGTNTATLPAATGTVMVSGNMPAFSVYANGGQTIANLTFTKVQFNNKTFDTANAFDSTTNYRFTPQVAGYYQINSSVSFSSMTGATELSIYKNGSALYYGTYPNNSTSLTNLNSICGLVYLNGSTDYVEIYCYQSSGLSVNLSSSGSAYVWLNGAMVRAA